MKKKPKIIIPPLEAFPAGTRGDLKKALETNNYGKPFTLDNFKEELYKFFSDNPEKEKEFERNNEYMQKISPYLDMTEAQMNECIPDGAYDISGGGMVAWTGKGGFIMSILAMQKELKKYK